MSSDLNTPARPPGPTGGSRIPLIFGMVAGVILVALGTSILLTPGQDAAPAGAPAVPAGGGVLDPAEAMREGSLAPDFALDSLAGTPVQLSSFRGQKAVWLNFWTTWCTYCRVEMPEMEQIYQLNKDQRIEILGVNDMETRDQAAAYFQAGGYHFNSALDVSGTISHRYRISGLPTHVFISRDGVIQKVVTGGLDRPTMDAAVRLLLVP